MARYIFPQVCSIGKIYGNQHCESCGYGLGDTLDAAMSEAKAIVSSGAKPAIRKCPIFDGVVVTFDITLIKDTALIEYHRL